MDEVVAKSNHVAEGILRDCLVPLTQVFNQLLGVCKDQTVFTDEPVSTRAGH